MIFAEHANIFPAMIKARAAVSEIVKDSKGNYGRYADLATINAAIQPALGANGLAIVQEVSTDPVPNGLLVTVETWLCHSSGEYIQFTPLVLPVSKPDAQGVGSAITYGRRYTLMAALNLSADDDDGQAAVGKPITTSKPTTQQRPPLASEKHTPEPPAENGDVLFAPENGNGKHDTPASDATLVNMHELGTALYDKLWDTKRHELVKAITDGRTQSSKELTEAEAKRMNAGMAAKLASKPRGK
jgi:hypothetical protein